MSKPTSSGGSDGSLGRAAMMIGILVLASLWGCSSGEGPFGFLEPEKTPTYIPRAPLNGYNPYNPNYGSIDRYNPYNGSIDGGESDYTDFDPVPMCPGFPGPDFEC